MEQSNPQMTFRILAFIVAFSLIAPAVLAETESAEPEATVQTEPKDTDAKWVRGSLDIDFDGIWADGESDIDLNQTLNLRIDPPKHKRIHIRSSLWMHEDIDSDEEEWSALRDINGISDSDIRANLLHLYVDIDDLWGDSVLRIGRQRILEGAAFNRIDGIYFKQSRKKWDWYSFAGGRASLYRDAHNDTVYGGGLSFFTSPKSRFAIDSYFTEEGVFKGYGRGFDGTSKLHDKLLSLSVWHGFTPTFQVFSRYDWRDGEGDKFLLSATGYVPSLELSYELAYTGQFNTVERASNDLTGFYRILGSHEEYNDFLASFHISLTKKLGLSLEGQIHNAHHDEWSTANRDFHRYALILSAEELPLGLDSSISVERWDVTGGENTWALTGEVRKTWKDFEFVVGADYERYRDKLVRYNSFPRSLDQIWIAISPNVFPRINPAVLLLDTSKIETHENIHSFYTKTKWAIRKNQDIRLDLSYEHDDGPESPYFRVRTSYELRF